MKTLYEQIFDRRCDAASVGNEVDVRFYDELMNRYRTNDQFLASEKRLEAKLYAAYETIKRLEGKN